jgi:hypothetical protein
VTLFLSYAHQDLDVVTSLRRDLEDLGQTVWLDESLHGGQIWWEEILRQVRQCNGFVLAVSARSLDSEACLAEWEYAVDLARPFLPVRIDATDWTGAPERMRQSQHIDYEPNDVDSVKALAKSLGGFSQAVPLPAVLPAPPPTPLSYHERYAKLFGQTPLTFDDQITYFARLTTDIDSVNAKEALELLTVLRNREDLTVKMGKRIDEYIAQRTNGVAATSAPVIPPVILETVEEDPQGATEPDAQLSATETDEPPKKNRLPLILAIAAGVLAIAGIVIFAISRSSGDKPPVLTENTTCDANNCSDPPIRFLDISGDPDVIKVTITDPYGVSGEADPPTPYGAGLQWQWSPNNEDPIGDYKVEFAGTADGTVEHDFTVNPVDGAFGAVQRAGQAIANRDWDAAAEIDHRIKDELDENGKEFLDTQYPTPSHVYWLPYDSSGERNANGTTIVGAFVTYIEAEDTTSAYCELWSVDPGDETMRSAKLPREEDVTQHKTSVTGDRDPSDFYSFVSEDCANLTTPS